MAQRLIDADELRVLFNEEFERTKQLIVEGETHLDTLAEGYAEAWHIVNYRALSVDAVPVVRCRECKYGTLPGAFAQRYGKPGTLTCTNSGTPCSRRLVASNDFCSYGERKEDKP